MTNPCLDPNTLYATSIGSMPVAVEAYPTTQWNHAATATQLGFDLAPPLSGGAVDQHIHTATAVFTNTLNREVLAYAMVSRSGSQFTLTARNRFTLNRLEGVIVHTNPAVTPTLTLASRCGGGVDTGLVSGKADYAIWEERFPPSTVLLGGGPMSVPVGQSFIASAQIRLVSEFVDTAGVDGGNTEMENRYKSGDTRVDIFIMPPA